MAVDKRREALKLLFFTIFLHPGDILAIIDMKQNCILFYYFWIMKKIAPGVFFKYTINNMLIVSGFGSCIAIG